VDRFPVFNSTTIELLQIFFFFFFFTNINILTGKACAAQRLPSFYTCHDLSMICLHVQTEQRREFFKIFST
jgi:hypothetical protein